MKNRKNIDVVLSKRWEEDAEFPDSGDENENDEWRLTVNNPSLQPGGWKPDPSEKKKDHIAEAGDLIEQGKLWHYAPEEQPLPEKGHWESSFKVYDWHKRKKHALPKLL